MSHVTSPILSQLTFRDSLRTTLNAIAMGTIKVFDVLNDTFSVLIK